MILLINIFDSLASSHDYYMPDYPVDVTNILLIDWHQHDLKKDIIEQAKKKSSGFIEPKKEDVITLEQ